MTNAEASRRRLLLSSAALGAMAPRIGGARAEAASVRFATLWWPQAQFAGYYVAMDEGFYRARGLSVEILHGGPGKPAAQLLARGEADFATLWLITALSRRDAGIPLVHLAQVLQRSSLMLVWRRASGIRKLPDLQTRPVGLWSGDLAFPYRSLLAQHGVTVRAVPQSLTVNLFLRGLVDACSATWYNEYYQILNASFDAEDFNTLFLSAEGLDLPEDGLYALSDTVRRDPARARHFVEASIEGWRHAFAHPEQALERVERQMREARVPFHRPHQRWMLEKMRELAMPSQTPAGLGLLQPAGFDTTVRVLREHQALRTVPRLDTFRWSDDAQRA